MLARRHRLAQRLRSAGYSQEQLAEALGIERSTVVRWERGETEPQPCLRPKVARTLQISLEQLDDLLSEVDGGERRISTSSQPSTPADMGLGLLSRVDTAVVEMAQDPEARSAGVVTGWMVPASTAPEPRITISGSRTEDTDSERIDDAVRSLGRLLVRHRCRVVHGPVGVGIEVMTHIADHYRPPGLGAVTGLFGRANVICDADFVLLIGGGAGTQAEFDLAISMGKKVIPMPSSGGTAAPAFEAMKRQPGLRNWIGDEDFDALSSATEAEDYVSLVERLLTTTPQTSMQR